MKGGHQRENKVTMFRGDIGTSRSFTYISPKTSLTVSLRRCYTLVPKEFYVSTRHDGRRRGRSLPSGSSIRTHRSGGCQTLGSKPKNTQYTVDPDSFFYKSGGSPGLSDRTKGPMLVEKQTEESVVVGILLRRLFTDPTRRGPVPTQRG